MAQEQLQGQEQRLEQQLKQTQTITHQQLLQAMLTELPITQLQERINAEMDDNPALEISSDEPLDNLDNLDPLEPIDNLDNSDNKDSYEQEERQSALDAALESIGRDDEELPVYHGGQSMQEEREEMVYGQTTSFIDLLTEQMNMANLTERERNVMEYLIGSLDDDGLLRKPLDAISDELAIYHNIDVSTDEVEHILHQLQEFDPAGIGARTLQECLLLQVERREPSQLKTLMEKALKHYFDRFTKKHWDALQQGLKLNDLQAEMLIAELRKLNPKPGASISETIGRSMQQITPDFIVDTHSDGSITFSLNNSEVPELAVSPSFLEALKDYQSNQKQQSLQMKEAMIYTKRKLEAAMGFIEAIRVRQQTLTETMRAIIHWQRRFFEDGDEASLRPMILKDIAERTGYDLSTISRVSKSKYVQTRWGTFPLRYFFSDSYVTESGEELSTREIKAVLRELIEHEDKRKPLSDEALRLLLAEKGYPIARRTVTKYREQLGLPVARLRK